MLDEFFTSRIKFNSCFINYKRQSQKVKVSTDNPFSSFATECILGIPHLEIRTNFCNSKTVYVTLQNYFKQCNNTILVFVLAICPTNKEEKQGDNIFSWRHCTKYFYISILPSMSLVDSKKKIRAGKTALEKYLPPKIGYFAALSKWSLTGASRLIFL